MKKQKSIYIIKQLLNNFCEGEVEYFLTDNNFNVLIVLLCVYCVFEVQAHKAKTLWKIIPGFNLLFFLSRSHCSIFFTENLYGENKRVKEGEMILRRRSRRVAQSVNISLEKPRPVYPNRASIKNQVKEVFNLSTLCWRPNFQQQNIILIF